MKAHTGAATPDVTQRIGTARFGTRRIWSSRQWVVPTIANNARSVTAPE